MSKFFDGVMDTNAKNSKSQSMNNFIKAACIKKSTSSRVRMSIVRSFCLIVSLCAISVAGYSQNIFSDGFESGNSSGSTTVSGWTNVLVSGTRWTAQSGTATHSRTFRSGSWYCWQIYSSSGWLIHSANVINGSTYQLSYWIKQDGSTTSNVSTKAAWGTTATAAGMTNTFITAAGFGSTFVNKTGTFAATSTATIQVGIFASMNGTPWYNDLDDISFDCLSPDIINWSAPTAATGCAGSAETVTINSTTLDAGTYTINYSLSGANSISNQNAALTMGTNTGTFSIPSGNLPNSGSTTVTINSISNGSYLAYPSLAYAASNSVAFTLNKLPTSIAPTATTPVCVGNTITLTGNVTGGSGYTLAWTGNTTGIGSASSANTTIPSAVLANAGAKTLTATALGCAGSTVGTTAAVVVNQLPSSIAPTATPNPACVGGTITLTGNVTGGTGYTLAWTGNTTGIVNAATANTTIPSAVLANAGAKTLTATALGCAGSTVGNTAALVVNQLPLVAPTATPNPVCVGGTITLTGNVTGGSGYVLAWSGNTTGILSASSANTTIPSAILANAGAKTLTATALGCVGSAVGNTAALTVNQLPSSIAPTATPDPACVGGTIALTGNVSGGSGYTLSWSGNTTGIVSSSSENTTIPSAILANAGVKTLTATASGCSGSTVGNTAALVVNQLPSVAPTATPDPACVGGTITLTGNVTGGSGYTLAWSGNTTGILSASSANTTIPSAVLGNAGAKTLTATAPGCVGSAVGNTAALAVNQLPSSVAPTATPDPICTGNTITLTGNITGGSGYTLAWTGNTTGIADATAANTTIPSAILSNAGAKTLTATALGCAGSTSGNTTALVVNENPEVTTGWTSPTASIVSQGNTSTVTVNSTGLGSGTYTATYNLSGGTTAVGNTASLTMGASSGTFTTSAITGATNTTVTITNIQNGFSCNTSVSASNTAVINVTPTLTAAVGATVDASFDITFADNAAWRGAVTDVKIDGSSLAPSAWSVSSAGILTLIPANDPLLQLAGTKSVTVIGTGYVTGAVSQTIAAGAATKLAINTQPAAPATNGDPLATQPVVLIQDQYGNTANSTATINAAASTAAWTIGGTIGVAAVAGTATFTDLTASSVQAVPGAVIAFSSPGLTGISSDPFAIPAPPTWFAKATGALNDLSTWGQYVDGSGANPSSFTSPGTIFVVRNNPSPTLTADWNVNGFVIVGDSSTACNFTIPPTFALTGSAIVNVSPSATLTINNATVPANMGIMSAGSTVVYGALAPQSVGNTTYYNLTLQGSGVKTLPSGAGVDNILTMDGAATTAGTSPAFGAAATLTYAGSTSRNANVEWPATFSSSGGINLTGSGFINLTGPRTLSLNVPLTIASGSLLNVNSNSLTLGGNFTGTGTLFNAVVTLNGNGTQSVSGFTSPYFFTVSKTGGTATLTGNVTCAGARVNLGGTLNFGAGLTHTINGSIYIEPNSTLDVGTSDVTLSGEFMNNGTFTSGSQTVTFNAPGFENISGDLTGTNKFNNIVFSSAGAWILSNDIEVGGNMTVSAGTVNLGPGRTHIITGNLVVPGTINGGSSTLKIGGSASTIAGTFNPGISTVEFNNGSQNIPGVTYYNLTLTSPGTKTATGIVTVNNALSIASGIVFNMGTNQLLGAFTPSMAGATLRTQNGTLPAMPTGKTWDGTVLFDGAGTQHVADGTYNNITVATSGLKALGNSVTINGTMRLEGTATVVSAYATYGPSAALVYFKSGSFATGNEWPGSMTATGGVLLDNGGTLTLDGPRTLGLNTDLTIGSGATLNTGNFQMQLGGDLFNNGTFNAGSSPFLITGAGNQNIAAFSTTGSVTVTKTAGTATMQGNMSAASFTMNASGSTFDLGSFVHNISGDIALGGGSLNGNSSTLTVGGSFTSTGGTFDAGTGTVIYNSAVNGKSVLPGTYNDLTFTGGGSKLLTGNTLVNGTLTMDNGTLTFGSSNLTISENSFPIIGHSGGTGSGAFDFTNRLVISGTGKMKTKFADDPTVYYPIGNTTYFAPIEINVNGAAFAAAEVTIDVIAAKPAQNANTTNYINKYWTVSSTGITSPSITVISAVYDDADVVGSEALMASAVYGTAWTRYGNVNAGTNTISTGSTPVTDASFIVSAISTVNPTVSSVPNVLICEGTSTTLSVTASSGDPVLSYSWAPAAGLSTTVGPTTVASPTITTTYIVTVTDGNGFTGTASTTVTVSPMPIAYTVSGGGTICSGDPGPHVFLSNSQIGINYQLYRGSSPVGSATAGSGFALDFGAQATAGTYTVAAINATTLCRNDMAGSAVVTVNPQPVISGTSTICSGGSSQLSTTVVGGVWSSSNPAAATVDPSTGLVGSAASASGSTNISYVAAGCSASMVITVNPAAGPITGTATVCAGNTTTLVGAVAGGTWSSSDNALATVGLTNGIVTGVAAGAPVITYTAPGGCTATQVVTVNVSPAPISGTTTVCNGVTAQLSSPVAGGVWSSSTGATATVDPATGVVSSVAAGTTTISYLASGCPASVLFTVNAAAGPITGTATVCAGNTTTLAGAVPGGTWSSSNNALATVGLTTGVVTGVAAGTPAVTYTTTSGCTATQVVTVNASPAPISGTTTVCNGATAQLSSPVAGGVWSSSTSATATVDPSTGLVSSAAAGTTTISYLASGCPASVLFTVNAAAGPITGTATVCAGNTTTLAGAVPGGTWSSSNNALATVGLTTGVVTGVAAGTPAVTYTTTSGCTATQVVTVNASPAPISGTTTVCNGATAQLSSPVAGGVWSSSTSATATVDPSTGLVSSAAAGTTTISYLASGCPASVLFTVNAAAGPITGTATVCAGNTTTLAGAVPGGTWSSSNNALATVGLTTGVVTGVAAGTPAITYTTTSGCTATQVVTVNASPAPISGTTTVCNGATAQLSSPVAGGVWSSSTSATATVDPSTGLVSSAAAGTTTISYLASGCSASVLFTVNAAAGPITGTATVCAGNTTTLAGAVPGGTWSSSNNALATVGLTTGVVTGVAAGTPAITYTTTSGCTATQVVTVNASPAPISGTTTVCNGATAQLSSPVAGGVWSSSTSATATVDPSTGLVSSASAGATTISYLASGCPASVLFTVNAAASPITGTATVCVGASTTLVGGTPGGTWSSSDVALATVGLTNGIVTGVAAGAPAITYTTAAGCTATQAVTVNAAPVVFTMTGTGSYCSGSGVSVGLSGSESGVDYQLYKDGVLFGAPVSGTGFAISFGTQTFGSYTAVGTNTSTLCSSNMNGAAIVTENPLPTVHTVTGGGSYCSGGSGVPVGLDGSQAGVNYQLFNGSTSTGSPVAGTGGAISFGLQTVDGTYSVLATNATTLCTNGMTGSATVTTNPNPAAIGGNPNVCVNNITTLTNAGTGTWSSSNPLIATVGLNTGNVTGVVAGGATVTFTSSTTGCIATIGITVNPLPSGILGNTSVCASSTTTLNDPTINGTWSSSVSSVATVHPTTGLVSGVTAGSTDISYTLPTGCATALPFTVNALPADILGTTTLCAGATTQLSNTSSGGTWASSNLAQATVGLTTGLVAGISQGNPVITYTLPTGCYTTTVLTVNALPTVYTMTGGGHYCSGTTQPSIGLNGSQSGVNYQLYRNGSTVGMPNVAGTGFPITFGTQDAATYTVRATPGTTCTADMTGPIVVVEDPLPIVQTMNGGGSYCSGGAGLPVGLNSSELGVNYQLFNNGVAVGSPVAGSGSGISFGPQTAAGSYSVNAVNAATSCTMGMGPVTITVNPPAGAISGSRYVCEGSTTPLSNTASGTWSSSNTFVANVGTASGIVTGIAAGSAYITFTLASTGCINTTSFTVNPLPGAMGGVNNVCLGSTTQLSNATPGGTWSSTDVARATVVAATGVVTGVALGNPAIIYTLPTGCQASVSVTINPLPASISGVPFVCQGFTTDLDNATPGGVWSSSVTSMATVDPGTGVVYGLNPDYPVITYRLPTGCQTTRTVTVYVQPGPIIGNTTICEGAFSILSNQTPGGAWSSETPSEADFDPGTTIVRGISAGQPRITYALPSGCFVTSTVLVNPLPTLYGVTGGGSYCVGGTGVEIEINGSQLGFAYQLRLGNVDVGAPVGGTGADFSFGLQTTAGTYTVLTTDPNTGCSTGMAGSATVSILPGTAIFNVTGGGTYCAGGAGLPIGLNGSVIGVNYQLYNGVLPYGVVQPGTGLPITFGNQTDVGNYTVVGTGGGCGGTMAGSVSIAVDPLPIAYTVSGGGSYCTGAPGVNIYLSGSEVGVNYQLIADGNPVGAPVAGTGLLLDFGPQTDSGSYFIGAINATTGCTNTMTDSAYIRHNVRPTAYVVGGGGSYCAGGTGVHVTLTGSQAGVNYQLYNGLTAVGSPLAGTGTTLDFGLQTAAGTYTVSATNATTGCTNNMTGSVNVSTDPLPGTYTVTGGGSYCPGGTGVHIGLAFSVAGVNYQLYNGSAPVGVPLAGTNAALDFGLQTTAGTYTVYATNAVTGCSSNMAGNATVSINTLPFAYTVTGGGSYCSGGTGVSVGLSGSATGVNYQLYNGLATVGGPVAGTGSALDFGLQTASGTYTVKAVNTTTTCTNDMGGSATVTVNTVPTVYAMTGGGSYCPGGAGVEVGITGSQVGVSYQLYNGLSTVGAPVAGTGNNLSFGFQTVTGTYTVKASNGTCTSNMTGSAVINTYTSPTVFSVTGGGTLCAGGSGFSVGLAGSSLGVNYQLIRDGSPVGSPVAGTGFGISFGTFTTAGSYFVSAINATTSCTSNMTGSAIITVNPLPTAYAVTGGGGYCAGGTGVNVGLANTTTGVNYQLYRGSAAVGAPVAGTGFAISFGLQTTVGTYSIAATNPTTTCTNGMTGGVTVFIHTPPTAYTVGGGGGYCAGGTGVSVTLSGSATGVSYALYVSGNVTPVATVSGTGAALDFGLQTTGGIYSVIATDGTTTCTNNMTGTATVTVNALPIAAAMTGGGSYCAGGSGMMVGLTTSQLGVNYQLYRGGSPVGSLVAGTGFALNLGVQTVSGIYTASAVNATTGCTNLMTGSATVTMNALPVVYTVAGGGAYCAGSAGPSITVSGSEVGVNYQLYRGVVPVGSPLAGTGAGLDFGPQATAGTYSVVATNASTTCVSSMSGNPVVTVNPQPTVHNVTGGGNYCAGGTGVHVGLDFSDAGINYRLYNNGVAMSGLVPGTGLAIDFGLQTVVGTYTVTAIDATTGCTRGMVGLANVGINPLPNAFTVTGGGHYCAGGTGVHVMLNGSNTGINYQLYIGGVADGSPMAGTGSSIDFGLKTAAGAYTVVATNTSTSCVNNMTGSVTVTIDPLPVAYNVTGTGSYCAGGTGLSVGLSNSATGFDYNLYRDGIFVATLAGTGSPLNFGLQTTAGTYTVNAVNTTTNCVNGMNNSAVITIDPLPTLYAVTGGGAYCAGGAGLHVYLSGSNTGISYQLFRDMIGVGSPVAGTGGGIDFGLMTNGGSYTVRATNNTTGCVRDMAAAAVIVVNPLPDPITGFNTVCAGSATDLNDNTAGGTWSSANSAIATVNPTTGLVTGVMAGSTSIIYTLPTGCSVSQAMTVNPLPLAYTITGGGGYCIGGTGVTVGLSGSVVGIDYTLTVNGYYAGLAVQGTGAALSFGLQTTEGTYSVFATNTTTGCVGPMTGTVFVAVNPLPTAFALTGGGHYCAGGTGMHVGLNGSTSGVNYQLYINGIAFGSPVAGTNGTIDFGLQTTDGVYSVVATNATTGCVNSMTGTATVVVDPLPLAYTVTGGGTYCAGGAGFHVGLSNSQVGVNYQLSRNGNPVGGPTAGTGTALDFGTQLLAGNYTVSAINTSTSCTNSMSGTATIVVNPVPSVYAVTGGGSYCSGGTGVHVNLFLSNSGISYQLYRDGIATGAAVAGTGAGLDFGLQIAPGLYTVVATNTLTLCTSNMSGNATVFINPLPQPYAVTGGGAFCAGSTGLAIILVGSEPNVNYQLYNGSTPVGTPLAGSGSSLDFGIQSTAGTYSVSAVNTLTGCTNAMTGSATITINPLPATYGVTGGGHYCAGGTGVAVTLANSESGMQYQLYRGLSTVGSAITSTGGALNFGLQTVAGTYTVKATNPITGCSVNMTGSATVTIDPLPTIYTVQGGGSYCAGGTGVNVSVSNSEVGVNYQLYVNGTPVSIPVAGIGGPLSFGLQTTAGTYSVMATNATTGCVNAMNSSVTVSIDPLPTAFTMTGGGGYCPGGIGVVVGLSGSESSVEYQLYLNGTTPIGSPVPGTTGPLNFGIQAATGAYTVVARNIGSNCTNNMTGTATIFIHTPPAVFTVGGTGSYCAGGIGLPVILNGSQTGVNYQLYLDGIAQGSPMAGTNSMLDFGLQTAAGLYTVIATNVSTTCVSTMAASATITIDPLPTQYTVTGGGSYCTGGTGVSVGLDNSDPLISYQLMYNGNPVGSAQPGNNAALDFGLQTAVGVYSIEATNTVTGCVNSMLNTVNVATYVLPNVYAVSGGGHYCDGGTGVTVTLPNSESGINYQLYVNGVATGTVVPGTTGTSISFGLQTTAGTYTVLATNATTGCINAMTGSATVTIDALPDPYVVGGGGSYCSGGAGMSITLGQSAVGINYQLYFGSTPVGTIMAGTGSPINFGLFTAAGTYSVMATNASTGCVKGMTGSATISINALPNLYNVSPGGSYCTGGAGVHIGINGSEIGISYQLLRGSTPVGSPLAGNGLALDFGLQTVTGFYTVIATNTTTMCTRTMTGSGAVIVNPLPVVFSMTGGGVYCNGSTGVHVGLSGSNVGIRYQLYVGATAVGAPVAGTGSALDFGVFTASGSYSAVATNISSGCASNMSGAVTVAMNPLPTAYTVTGGGDYCAGGAGVAVGLSNSQTNVRYQLYNGVTAIGLPVMGTGSPITFGPQVAAGSYVVSATNILTGCAVNMFGSATVTINLAPTVFSVTGGGTICAGGTPVNIGLTNSTLGLSYQLYRGAVAVGGVVGGTGGAISFAPQSAAGNYVVVANNTATGCSSNMNGSATVVVNPLPTQYNVTGGGTYCAGGTGVGVGLSYSAAGTLYRLYNGTTLVTSITGTGGPLSFGLQTGAGVYTVIALTSSTGCTTNMAGSATIVVTPSVVPSVSIVSTTNDTICAGISSTFTALVTNGGTAPTYDWKVNGTSVGNTGSYGYTPANGDVITMTVTSSAACASPATVSSSTTMTVLPKVAPSVTVSAAPGTTICKGTLVTFTANPTAGGTAPTYVWTVNGVNKGTGAYYFDSPENGDVVIAVMTSNYECRLADVAFSPNVVMTVDSPAVPQVSIVATPGTTIALGQKDTLTAVIANAIAAPQYQWLLNGHAIAGATNATYVSGAFFDNDEVTCEVTNTEACGTAKGSASVTIHISTTGVASVNSNNDVRLIPNPNKGNFTVKGTFGSADEASIEITNMLGQVIMKETIPVKNGRVEKDIQMGNVASGMYLLTLRSGADAKVFHVVVDQ